MIVVLLANQPSTCELIVWLYCWANLLCCAVLWCILVLQIVEQLDAELSSKVPRPGELAVRLLAGAALLAVQPDGFARSELGMRLLVSLARAPLRSLTPGTLRLARFAWSWVRRGTRLGGGGGRCARILRNDAAQGYCASILCKDTVQGYCASTLLPLLLFPLCLCHQVAVESPEVSVPLICNLASAWIWTLDQRLGLFSGGAQSCNHLMMSRNNNAETHSAGTGGGADRPPGADGAAGSGACQVQAGGGALDSSAADGGQTSPHDEATLQVPHTLAVVPLMQMKCVV